MVLASFMVMVDFICIGLLELQGAKTANFLPTAGLELTIPEIVYP